jgi:hypothetical protein
MASRDDKHISKASVMPGRKPDMTATAFSFTRQLVLCSTYSIHSHWRAHHSTKVFSSAPVRRILSNVPGGIRKPRARYKHELRVLKCPALRIVRYSNKQNRRETASPAGAFSNFFPFDTGPIGQWCGGGRHALAGMVPRII